jgi:hypothetical protein
MHVLRIEHDVAGYDAWKSMTAIRSVEHRAV